jgi:hypothetical protein
MTVEVVIPSLRQAEAERLVWSLAHQTHPPDVVTVVSNETQPFENFGGQIRLLRFSSDDYGVGDLDVALRQNAGIWETECDVLIIQGDDQIAPPSMVEDTLRVMGEKSYIWGNHRLIDFSAHADEEIRLMPREAGQSRESSAPAQHGYWSCYGGMFAANAEFLREVGGFDMAFNGRHGGEDQALGYRLMRRDGQQSVWICDPPFSWHGIELKYGDTRSRSPWLEPITNGCGKGLHDFIPNVWRSLSNDVPYLQCRNCPVWHCGATEGLFRDEVLVRYQPELVQTMSVWL